MRGKQGVRSVGDVRIRQGARSVGDVRIRQGARSADVRHWLNA